jgi:DNA-directed RNA polymerase subunit M/transcription elongation factor TFIIS
MFSKSKGHLLGIRYYCKSCASKASIKSAHRSQAVKTNNHKTTRENKRYKVDCLQKEKEIVGCYLCGYNKCHHSLHFHHIDPKTKLFNLGDQIRSVSYEKIQQEINKCVLLCSNCHYEVESGYTDLVLDKPINPIDWFKYMKKPR